MTRREPGEVDKRFQLVPRALPPPCNHTRKTPLSTLHLYFFLIQLPGIQPSPPGIRSLLRTLGTRGCISFSFSSCCNNLQQMWVSSSNRNVFLYGLCMEIWVWEGFLPLEAQGKNSSLFSQLLNVSFPGLTAILLLTRLPSPVWLISRTSYL